MATITTLAADDRKQLALRARYRREQIGLSRAGLAELIGRDSEQIAAMEARLPLSTEYDAAWERALQVETGWLRDSVAVGSLPVTLRSLCATFPPTFAGYMRAVFTLCACKASRRAKPDQLSPGYMRNIEILMLRYGAGGENRSTLQSIADEIGMTRERVRQVCEKLLNFIPRSDASPEAAVRLREAALPHLPSRVRELDEVLRADLGEHLSVVGADRFAREILGTYVVHFGESRGAAGEALALAFGPDEIDDELINAAYPVSVRMTRSVGAAQVHLVAGKLSEELDRRVSPNDVRTAVGYFQHTVWLDKEDGWFMPAQVIESRAFNVAMKVLSVADRAVSVDEIHSAMARGRPGQHPWRPSGIVPPAHILVDILEQCPFLERRQYNTFRMVPELSQQEIAETYLSETEMLIRDAIIAAGGFIQWNALREYVVVERKQLQTTFTMAMDTTPIVHRLDLGLWSLTGRRLPQIGK